MLPTQYELTHLHPRLYGSLPRRHLVPHPPHNVGGGPHEPNPRRYAGLGEVSALREEAVAGVDRVHVVLLPNKDAFFSILV